MTLEWDERVIAVEGVDISKPPRRYTKQTERFCAICENPMSLIKYKKKLKKNLEDSKMRFLLNHLEQNHLRIFSLKDLVLTLNPYVTDGTLQNKQMAILVALGAYHREVQEFKDAKGKKKIKYMFLRNAITLPPSCYDPIKDKHRDDVDWTRRTIFDPKAQISEDKE